ncbi:hypothetical protein PN497_24805 [Sphaerospermopsis kisseleviana CS-549]|uniref:Uncharacterized protein n=2 Tax=Sphaerospermopsis TaxID=752201 RepID=A0A480A064_9CYAN|nr:MULTISPECIES: hypothetical protein [Sphaerospermopsis]MDB9444545.1 hypothetical protein [Sphaerospermopsis kisseleviana CS-549]BAZ82230.1 hypothetical protein NIES73_35010 [Sphaerospermopsis kisseleviana NIES-73]GCL37226.1 hypothetical protein SR1949_23340 [Sphaerospermopsis reniformis]
MQSILLSSEEVAKRAKELYETIIRSQVETEENIGKMVIIDIETGEYAVDKTGIESARYLRNKNRFARLFGIRIGYKVAASFSGEMERDYR